MKFCFYFLLSGFCFLKSNYDLPVSNLCLCEYCLLATVWCYLLFYKLITVLYLTVFYFCCFIVEHFVFLKRIA